MLFPILLSFLYLGLFFDPAVGLGETDTYVKHTAIAETYG